MSGIDIVTPIGFVIAVGALLVSVLIDGGSMRSLINLPAILLVVGGTIGATMMGLTMREITKLPGFLISVVRPKATDAAQSVQDIADLAEIARREGLLRLEDQTAQRDLIPFLSRGVQFVVDGADEERIRSLMGEELGLWEEQQGLGARIFEMAGGFAPTLGIIGTVVGLVSVLSNLSNISKLAPSIATAFIATLWGVSSANLFWLPIATKLKSNLQRETRTREMIIEGCVGIAGGQNPRLLKEQLSVYVVESGSRRRANEAVAEEGVNADQRQAAGQ